MQHGHQPQGAQQQQAGPGGQPASGHFGNTTGQNLAPYYTGGGPPGAQGQQHTSAFPHLNQHALGPTPDGTMYGGAGSGSFGTPMAQGFAAGPMFPPPSQGYPQMGAAFGPSSPHGFAPMHGAGRPFVPPQEPTSAGSQGMSAGNHYQYGTYTPPHPMSSLNGQHWSADGAPSAPTAGQPVPPLGAQRAPLPAALPVARRQQAVATSNPAPTRTSLVPVLQQSSADERAARKAQRLSKRQQLADKRKADLAVARGEAPRLACPTESEDGLPLIIPPDEKLYSTLNAALGELADLAVRQKYTELELKNAWEDIEGLEDQNELLRAHLAARDDEEARRREQLRNIAHRHPQLKDAVHRMTQKLLGIASEKDELPAPLETGDAPRVDPVSKGRLWNPDWEVQVSAKINQDFLNEVVKKTLEQEEQLGAASLVPAESRNPNLAHSIAKGYWRHLSGVYVAQTSEPAAEKKEGRKAMNRLRGRRHTTATHLRQAAAAFDAQYGVKDTIALVDSDLCSDLLSSDDEHWDDEIAAERTSTRAGKGAWVRMPPQHRNKTCTAIYYRLASIHASAGGDATLDVDDEVPAGRKRKSRGAAAPRKRAPVTKRFHAPHGKLSSRVPGPPKASKAPVPLNLVSKRFLSKDDNVSTFITGAPIPGFDPGIFKFKEADFLDDDWDAIQAMESTDDETATNTNLAITSRQSRPGRASSRAPSVASTRSTSRPGSSMSDPPSSPRVGTSGASSPSQD